MTDRTRKGVTPDAGRHDDALHATSPRVTPGAMDLSAEAMTLEAYGGLLVPAEVARLRGAIADKGGTEHSPTQWAYDQACAALERQRARAERAEANVAMLRSAIVYAITKMGQSAQDMPAMRAERHLRAALAELQEGGAG